MTVVTGAPEGWANGNHPSRHFWRAGRALCNRDWPPPAALEVDDRATVRDCRHCRRMRDRQIHAAKKNTP